tara:strand:+ start:151 stop:546 length:396 start_codon:yes stop_codon:yes gene_type:complete
MQAKDYWKVSSLLLMSLLVSSCSTWDKLTKIEVQTVEVERNVPIQNRPRQLQLSDIYWYVVTESNFVEFKKKFIKENGDPLVAYVISVKDYETLAIDMAEIKRYIDQQKQIIIYYEKALSPKEEEPKEDKK